MLSWFLGVFLICALLYVVPKIVDSSDKKRWEKESMQNKINELEVKTMRQESVITGLCPQCKKKREDSLVCSNCGFEFVDGTYCDGCSEFLPYEQLESRRDMDLNWIYECKSCLNTVDRKY